MKKSLNQKRNNLAARLALRAAALGLLALPGVASAQFFSVTQYGDTLACFRKTGTHQDNYELVVNIGNITNFIALAQGATVNVTNYSPAQLTDAFPDGYKFLQWSVSSTFQLSSPWVTAVGTFPRATLWYTLARTNSTVQSAPPARLSVNNQSTVRSSMLSIDTGANIISTGLATTNADNNSVLVREPVSNSDEDVTAFIGDAQDSTIGDFGGHVFSFSVENTTPSTFTAAVRSDLYQACPTTTTDPITGTTTGAAYYVGYFQLNPDGTMSFTRASTTVTAPPPPAPVLSVKWSATTATISFTATNTATYTLYYTNAAGLSHPVTNWAVAGTSVTGVTGVTNFTDTSTDGSRFYKVVAH